jgi:hypothetical protein
VATTTNYGWSTPDNTGYVKDGALAIRTLGTAVDASMAVLRGGTTGQVLQKASNSQMDIVWGTVSSTPRIGQVVQATTTTDTQTSSTTYVDATNINGTITPTLSTSKVLVTISTTIMHDGNFNVAPGTFYQIVRGSTSVYEGGYNLIYTNVSQTASFSANKVTLMYLDSPATTSATTYKLQIKRTNGTAAGAGYNGVSTIILQEVLV